MITAENISTWLKHPNQMEAKDIAAIQQAAIEHPYCAIFPYLLLYHAAGRKDSMQLREQYGINPILLDEWLNAPLEPLVSSPDQDMESAIEQPFNDTVSEALLNFQDEITDTLINTKPSGDYFMREGIAVSSALPDKEEFAQNTTDESSPDQSLMVVMSFSEWLNYLHKKTKKSKEEEADKRALQSSWRRQKLAAAIEEENEDIPDQVFEMAVNSIAAREDVVSEALAEVYVLQRKIQKAIDMYRKLSLQNPEKSIYFAHKIETLQKEI